MSPVLECRELQRQHTFVTSSENALRLIQRELVFEQLDVLLHRSCGTSPPQLAWRGYVDSADAEGLCGEHHVAACGKAQVQPRLARPEQTCAGSCLRVTR